MNINLAHVRHEKKLQMCPRHGLNLLFLVVYGKRRIVVHLQSFLDSRVFFAAAFTAAAAASAAETQNPGDYSVPRLERVQWQRQEVPGSQDGRQKAGEVRLHDVNYHHHNERHRYRYPDAHQDLPAGDGESQNQQRQNEKAQDKIDDGKPAVLGCAVAQSFGQTNG